MLRKISTPDFVALDTPAVSCLLAIKAIKPKKANRLFTTELKKAITSCDRSLSNTIYTSSLFLCIQYLHYPNLLHYTQDSSNPYYSLG